MPGFELDIPKASTPSPGSVPKIPLGVVGNPGMENFGRSLQSAAHTVASTVNLLNGIEKQQKQQEAMTYQMNSLTQIEDADDDQLETSQAEALSEPGKQSSFAKTHLDFVKSKFSEFEAKIPKGDTYAQMHWAEVKNQYLRKRRDELNALQGRMIVGEFENATKRMVGRHESRLNAAQSLDELNAVSDTDVLREFDQTQESAIKNRVTSRAAYDANRLNVLGNFQRVRFNRMLELDPQVAGVQFRNNGMARTEDILKAIPSPDQRADMGTLDVKEQEGLRGAYKARVAMVAKNFIIGGHANQQTVLGLHEQVKFDSKTFDDLMQTATQQANNVHIAAERDYQEQHRAAEATYNKAATGLWDKLFKRKLTPNDMEAAEKSHIFDMHPETFHTLHQAMKTQHDEDLGVNAEATKGEFLQTEVAIKSDPNSPDVKPEKWIGSNMSWGQKSSLYSTLKEWQEKTQKDPRLHSDQFKHNQDRLVNDTGGAMLSFNGGGNAAQMLQLRGVLLSMYTERVLKGDSPDKAYGVAHKYALSHPAMGAREARPVAKANYVPLTNDQINAQFTPGSPAWYDAIEDRSSYEQSLVEAEEQKKLDEESRAAAAAELARPSFFNAYGLIKK